MTSDSRVGTLSYGYPFYEDLLEPEGALALDRRSHACWYYTLLAMRARRLHAGGIDNQIIEYRVGDEIPTWYESRDEEIARSVAIIYGLESPDEFLKDEWKKRAWAQAQMLGVTPDARIYEVRPGVKRLN